VKRWVFNIPILAADQHAVVVGSLDSRVVVTAGPGTGKTHTLVSRIEHLIADGVEVAGQEVLSLSFSRAAVSELQRRVATLSGRGSRVRSATFDSFATRLLEAYGDRPLNGLDYDRRIELATDLIGAQPIDELSETRHVLIDEAQDLTGVRADFVLRLMEATDCGFTVFADHAQAIYDFAGKSTSEPSFVERVMSAYEGAIETLHLTNNHRTTDSQLLAVARLGELIREPVADRGDVIKQFDHASRGLPAAGSIGDAAWMLQGSANAAILTRRNNEALAVSNVLYKAGVEHQLRRRADDPAIGPWLSRLARATSSHRITLADLERSAALLPWNSDVTWAALSRAARPRKDSLNLDQIAEQLATGLPPDELLDYGTDGVVVSSIHRAKGLEFDTVLLVPFDIDEDDWLQEERVLYVGLTRAKRNLMTLKPVDDRRWSYATRARRWRRVGFAGRNRYTTGVEVSGADAFTFDPTGASPPRIASAAVCDYLLTDVERGDLVLLERRSDAISDCIYDVMHNGHWVAATTPEFGEIITGRLDLKSPPSRVEGCRVEMVSTTALPASVAEVFGLREQLVPNCRIQGVGTW
jgi:hypothetical protein